MNDWHPAALPKAAQIKKYEITAILGVGGFGITYLAKDLNLGRLVAVKEHLPFDFSQRKSDYTIGPISESHRDDYQWAISAFLKEAKTLASFDTPAIVTVYDYFEGNGTAYMVMKYIEGQSLKAHVDQRGPLSRDDASRVFQRVTGALKFLHRDHIFHRDLKPSNIMIPAGTLDPVIIDFGSARQLIQSSPREVTTQLTEGFAPLEQYSSDSSFQGPWTDIYGFAATLYYCLTLKVPADAARRSNHLRHGKDDLLIPLRNLRNDLPADFARAIEKGLELHEKDRPQNVESWQGMIDWQTRPQPVPPQSINPFAPTPDAQPNPPTPPAPPTQKRSRKLVLSLALVALALILGGGIYHFQKIKAQDQNTAQENDNALYRERAALLEQQLKAKDAAERDRLQKEIDTKNAEIAAKDKALAESQDKAKAEMERLKRAAREAEEKIIAAQKRIEDKRIADLEEKRRKDEEERKKRESILSNRDLALNCSKNYYLWGGSDFPDIKQLELLASPVNFFGTNHNNLTNIRESHVDFCKTWTTRSFNLTKNTLLFSDSDRDFTIATEFLLTMESPSVKLVGKRKGHLTIRVENGKASITQINSETLGEDQKTYNKDGQFNAMKAFCLAYFKAGESGPGHSILDQLAYFRPVVSPYYDKPKATQQEIRDDLLDYARKFPKRSIDLTNLNYSGLGTEFMSVGCLQHVETISSDGSTRKLTVEPRLTLNFSSGKPLISGVSASK